MKRRTKIVCTLGPSTGTEARIRKLIEAGMNVARINCSHGTWEEREQWITWLRAASDDIHPVAILVDLQGPKFRIGHLPPEGTDVHMGQVITIGIDETSSIPLYAGPEYEAMATGDRVLLGDGEVQLKLIEDLGGHFRAKVLNGGTIKSRKGITLANKSFDAPCITEQDDRDIAEATRLGADFIALSYVRGGADMRELRRRVGKFDPSVRLVAKIETKEALHQLDEIIQQSDALMVARGDLGLQMDIEDVPAAQKKIIRHCFLAGKPVITATQMLESMMAAPRPTRAEASDVANAILDGTDAVMLSGETAAGQYPIETVEVMSRLTVKAEKIMDFKSRMHAKSRTPHYDDETDEVARAAVQIAENLNAKAIVTTSTSGATPRLVSRFRPSVPIYCACWSVRTQAFLSLVWGVEAVCLPEISATTDEAISKAIEAFQRHKRIKSGDRVVVTAGVPVGQPGSTNLILVQTV